MKRGFDRTECEVEGLLILIAGTESTACALRAALVHVMTTPRVYLRLKEEIREVAEKVEAESTVISYHTARQCPYLHVSCTDSAMEFRLIRTTGRDIRKSSYTSSDSGLVSKDRPGYW